MDSCELFLNKVAELRTSKNGLTSSLVSPKVKSAPIAVFRKISKELKRLKWLASQKKKELKYEFCWISRSGKLCMKKSSEAPVMSISSEEDLLKLK